MTTMPPQSATRARRIQSHHVRAWSEVCGVGTRAETLVEDPGVKLFACALFRIPVRWHTPCSGERNNLRAPTHGPDLRARRPVRSEEHTSELQSPYVISYAVFC